MQHLPRQLLGYTSTTMPLNPAQPGLLGCLLAPCIPRPRPTPPAGNATTLAAAEQEPRAAFPPATVRHQRALQETSTPRAQPHQAAPRLTHDLDRRRESRARRQRNKCRRRRRLAREGRPSPLLPPEDELVALPGVAKRVRTVNGSSLAPSRCIARCRLRGRRLMRGLCPQPVTDSEVLAETKKGEIVHTTGYGRRHRLGCAQAHCRGWS
jgi:hypothetical protein